MGPFDKSLFPLFQVWKILFLLFETTPAWRSRLIFIRLRRLYIASTEMCTCCIGSVPALCQFYSSLFQSLIIFLIISYYHNSHTYLTPPYTRIHTYRYTYAHYILQYYRYSFVYVQCVRGHTKLAVFWVQKVQWVQTAPYAQLFVTVCIHNTNYTALCCSRVGHLIICTGGS